MRLAIAESVEGLEAARRRLPPLVAGQLRLAHDVLAERDDLKTIAELNELVELVASTVGIFSVADYFSSGAEDKKVDDRLKSLAARPPAAGAWGELALEIYRILERPYFGATAEVFQKSSSNMIQMLTEFRNRVHRGPTQGKSRDAVLFASTSVKNAIQGPHPSVRNGATRRISEVVPSPPPNKPPPRTMLQTSIFERFAVRDVGDAGVRLSREPEHRSGAQRRDAIADRTTGRDAGGP